jgi:aspartate dehydrogenase
MRVAQIGFGGLGRIVARHLARHPDVHVVAIAGRAHQAEEIRCVLGDAALVECPEALLACEPDLVVECASHDAFRKYAQSVLGAGVDMIAVSSGVLADADCRERVLATAANAGASLEIPSGAIGAIDVVAAARAAGLERVTYVTRKSPKAWRGTPAAEMLDLDRVRGPKLFFDESAERAALLFTDKANVCATLALAGVGFERTRVQFWVDPAVNKSVHEIEADGPCGTLKIELANNVASDGKASLLTAMSIVRAVRNRTATLRL